MIFKRATFNIGVRKEYFIAELGMYILRCNSVINIKCIMYFYLQIYFMSKQYKMCVSTKLYYDHKLLSTLTI